MNFVPKTRGVHGHRHRQRGALAILLAGSLSCAAAIPRQVEPPLAVLRAKVRAAPAATLPPGSGPEPAGFSLALQPQEQGEGSGQKPQGKPEPRAKPKPQGKPKPESDEFLRLGTPQGLGGANWLGYERSRTKDLIRSFIPPLLRPGFAGHAFVLPPNAWQVSISGRAMTIDGNDFFKDSRRNEDVFGNFRVNRQLIDLDIFYGFDLGEKGLHNFTARINLPYRAAQLEGSIHPNGAQPIDIFTEGSVGDLGDIGLFLKKKFIDQAEMPIQIAGAFGLRLPTGSNSERYADGGRVKVRRPDLSGTGAPGAPPLNTPIPLSMFGSAPRVFTPFPFNNGVFGRFSDDGRLPSTLQPGTGNFSVFTGLFLTRVNQQDSFFGRSAFHAGGTHLFRFAKDGIDPGDKTTLFASFVKPISKDFLALDLSFVTFYQEADSYRGNFVEPEPTDAGGNRVASFDQATHVTFRQVKRAPFARGWTGFLAPGLILSPDPSIRMTASTLIRVLEPELGPAPEFVFRAGLEVIF